MQDSRRLTFGAVLRNYRLAAHMTQEDLAAHAGLSVYSISNIERGVAHTPRKTTLQLLAQALQLDAKQSAELMQAASQEVHPKHLASPRTATPTIWCVPLRRNPFFTGRSDILQQLHALLHHDQSDSGCQSCTVSGLGGIGKTQVAGEYAYRYADEYAAVFWMHAETRETISASIVTCAQLLDLPEHREHDIDMVVVAFSRWLVQTPGWLIIWDNVESPELITPLVPATRHGAMLFTSRRQALQLSSHVLDLPPLTGAEGTRFLMARSRVREQDGDAALLAQQYSAAQAIAGKLAGLPLALDQAGAYIEATQCRLDEYLRLFDASPVRLLADREPQADHPESVVKTLTLAFTQLQQENALAAELLTICAFLAPEDIPEDFFRQGAAQLGPIIAAGSTDPFQFQAAIKALLTYSLIQRHPATRAITVHRLVQTILQDYRDEEDRQGWAERVIAAMSSLFPTSDNEQVMYWQMCKQLLPHALVCITLGEQAQTDVTQRIALMHHVAYYFTNLAQFDAAEHLHQRALAMSEEALDPLHPLVTAAFNNLGRLYKEQGRYAEAEPLVLRALAIREQLLGPDHPTVATSQNNLALLYQEQGKYAEAEPLLVSAIRIWEQSLGTEHQKVGTAMNNLAIVYQNRAQYDQAEPLFWHVLHIWRQALGTDHPKVALPLNNIAENYLAQGRYAEAEPLLLQALQLTEHALGADHHHVTHPLINLGALYSALRRYDEAKAMYQRALSIKQRTFAATHEQVTTLQRKLAELASLQSREGDEDGGSNANLCAGNPIDVTS